MMILLIVALVYLVGVLFAIIFIALVNARGVGKITSEECPIMFCWSSWVIVLSIILEGTHNLLVEGLYKLSYNFFKKK